MLETDLRSRVFRHNAIQTIAGVLLIPTSIALWIGSFWLVRFVSAFLLDAAGLDGDTISVYVASAFMVVLAVEGVRFSAPLFDLKQYATSELFHDNFIAQSSGGRILNARYANPLGVAFLVSQALFCAPRSSVEAVNAFRALIPSNADTIAEAARILARLKQERQWLSASEYADSRAALMLLQKLRLMWTENSDGKLFIRYPAGVK